MVLGCVNTVFFAVGKKHPITEFVAVFSSGSSRDSATVKILAQQLRHRYHTR